MLVAILAILLGFVLLLAGAEYLVRGAAATAVKLKIPTVIIGLTVIALGTSIPELMVSIKAAIGGNAGISIGNVIGSNIANIWLVLGASVAIAPITYSKNFYHNFGFLAFASALFALFITSGYLVHWHGWVLLALLLLFIIYNYFISRKEPKEPVQTPTRYVNFNWFLLILVIVGGLAAVIYGADVLIYGAVKIAEFCNIPQEIIGLTIVAIGTSLPELATSCVAAFRHQNGIALGTVVGSCIWNIVCIMGVAATITKIKVANQLMSFDIIIMLLATFFILPLMTSNFRISRFEGIFMLVCYGFYICAQVLIAQGVLAF